jgi:hypothetical protein
MAPLASRLTLLACVICILAAVAALYARSAILDEAEFADRAVGALAQDEVAAELAQRFTDGVVERSPGLVTLRPAIESAAESVVAGPAFAAEFGAGIRALHREVFSGSGARPSLRVPEMAAEVQTALAGRTPVLATRLPRAADPALMSIGGTARERVLLRVARRARGLAGAAPLVLALGLLGLLLVVLTAPDRRRGLWASGLALGAAGGALAVAWIAARTLTLEGFDTGWGDAVVNTIWGAYLDDLRAWSFGLAGAGILVAAAARPDRVRLPAVPGALRGAGLLAAGGVLLADRDLAFDIAATTGAGVLLYLGACRLLAGRARFARAGAALAVLTAVVAVAASAPPHTPQRAASAEVAVRASAKAGRTRSSQRPAARTPRICFASMGDARVAAERAAIPEGAIVKQLADGRVCVRGR